MGTVETTDSKCGHCKKSGRLSQTCHWVRGDYIWVAARNWWTSRFRRLARPSDCGYPRRLPSARRRIVGLRLRFAHDSPLEQRGFEPSVPLGPGRPRRAAAAIVASREHL